MNQHVFHTKLVWTGASQGGTTSYAAYSREYQIEIEGKPTLRGSASPAFRGDAALANPEDWLVAALSACHCLSYLAAAARAGIVVTGYRDEAVGKMNLVGHIVRFTEVLLRPTVVVAPGTDAGKARELHEKAHAECFIASSVNFPVRHEATIVVAA